MADNSYKINKSVNYNPQAAAPANPVDGDFYYDSTYQSFAYYHNGSWANMDSVAALAFNEPLTSAQFTPAIVRNSVVKVTGASSPIHLKGISSSFAGKRLTIYNGGTDLITVESDDSGEPTSNNRILTPTGGDMNLIAGEVAVFTYDVIANRWLLVSISSQGGAQVIATTGHPGLVQLHQASLFPADGIVLSDGDLNTATGVVGLDANRAATIAAPLSSVTTLDITAAASASAVVLHYTSGTTPVLSLPSVATGSALTQKPGSDTDQFTLNNSVLQLGKRKLQFSDNDGFGDHYDNYIQYSYLGGTSKRGMLFVNQTVDGFAQFTVSGQSNGSGAARVDLIFVDSTANQDQITFDQGVLNLGYGFGAVNVNVNSGQAFTVVGASTNLWQFTSAGVLTAIGTNRAIQNVLDPVNVQDAATKNYVDHGDATNLVQNGGLEWYNRGHSFTTGAITSATAFTQKTADRWWQRAVNVSGSGTLTITNTRVAADSAAISKFAQRWELTAMPTGSYVAEIVHEFDRDYVIANRGKKLSVRVGMKCGSAFSGPIDVQIVTGTGGTHNEQTKWFDYTGSTNIYGENFTPTTTFTVFSTGSSAAGSALVIPSNATVMALVFQFSSAANNIVTSNNTVDITDVMVSATTYASDVFRYNGGSRAQDQNACRKYVEASWGDGDTVGSVSGTVLVYTTVQSLGIVSSQGTSNDINTVAFAVQKKFDNGTRYTSCSLALQTYDSSGGNAGMVNVSNSGLQSISGVNTDQNRFSFQIPTANDGARVFFHYLADCDLYS